MPDYQVLFDGTAAPPAFYEDITRLEVEENADLPDAVSLELPVTPRDGELSWVADPRVAPYANLSVVVSGPEGGPQCVFDGYVLGHSVRVPAGPTGATVDVRGQDASVLMGLTETVREWTGLSDADVAAAIFREYGITPAGDNSTESSPSHTEDEHTLMQRASDIDFLRRLARRTGRWCRVVCADKPGRRTGYFATPGLGGDPVVEIDLNDPDRRSTPVLDFRWDVARPTSVQARQAGLGESDTDQNGVDAGTSDSGLRLLADRSLADFAGRDRTVILTAPADTAELPQRAAGLLRESGWFASCEGTANLASLGRVLRVGDVVGVAGCGALLSGRWLVWSVRHRIGDETHAMSFVLVRNAMGGAS